MSNKDKVDGEEPMTAVADLEVGGIVEMTSLKEAPQDPKVDHVFSDPNVAAYWRNVYNEAKYESRHRFDPEFTWSAQSERLLKRKVFSFRNNFLSKV